MVYSEKNPTAGDGGVIGIDFACRLINSQDNPNHPEFQARLLADVLGVPLHGAESSVHRVYICPASDANGKHRVSNRGPMFEARFEGGLICVSVQPLLDSARVLLARGLCGPLEMWDGVLNYARMRSTIEAAAKLTITEGDRRPRFITYRSFDGGQSKEVPSSDQATPVGGDPDIAVPALTHVVTKASGT